MEIDENNKNNNNDIECTDTRIREFTFNVVLQQNFSVLPPPCAYGVTLFL